MDIKDFKPEPTDDDISKETFLKYGNRERRCSRFTINVYVSKNPQILKKERKGRK